MAKTSAIITVGGDTRQLERDIQSALSRDFKFKGLNEKAFTQPLGRITGAANEFQKSLDASNARVIAFGASAGLIYTVEKAFTNLIKTTVDVQKSLTDINVILNASSSDLAKFGVEIFNIAKNTGQSFKEVASAATEFARQGLGVEETLKRTRDALILTRLSGLDVVGAVEALTATINSFNKVALDSTTVINKLANVDAAFAVSSADLANAIQRVGSSAQDAGVGFDELLGIVTSVQQTTARGGAVIGNSLKTIFTRIQRTDVLDQLESLGLNVRSLEGNTLPAIQILRELAITFDQLSDSQRAQVAESVGGVFQINVLKAALGDLGKEYSVYDRALKTSATSTNEAIKRNEALNQTVSALFNRTTANIGQLASTVGAGAFQPAIENTLKNINKVFEFISSQDSESIGGRLGEGILKGLSTFISGPGIVLLTTVIGKLSLDLAKFATSGLKTLLGVNQQSEQRAQIQTKINQVLSQEPQLLAAISSKQINVLSIENQILKILQEQNALRTQAAAIASKVTPNLIAKGVSVKGGQITTKSFGFIPNYALSEIYGALAGGYKPGKIKEMNISGEGKVIYNSAEKVKKFPGMSQPAIIPPKASKAGKQYQKDFISQNGFDPYSITPDFYSSKGFIPNFALIEFPSAGLSPDQAYGANRFGKFKDAPDWTRKEYSQFVLDPVLGGKLIDKRWGRTPTREQRLKRIEKSRENREAFRLIQGLPISPSVLGTLNFYKNKKSYQYDSTGKMQIYKSADGNISLHEVRSHEYSGNESNALSVENGKIVLEDYSPDSDKKIPFNSEYKRLISKAGSALGMEIASRSDLTKQSNVSRVGMIRDNPLYNFSGFIPNFAGQNPRQQAQVLISTAKQQGIDPEELAVRQNVSPEVRGQVTKILGEKQIRFQTDKGKPQIVKHVAEELGIVGVNGRSGSLSAETSFAKLGYPNDPRIIRFEGIQARTLSDLKNNQVNSKRAFSTQINQLFYDPLADLANAIFGPISKDPKFQSALVSQTRKPGLNLFPPGTEGSIFEAAVNLGTKKGGGLEKAFDQDASQKPFDFEETAPPTASFNTKFGFRPPVLKADAKRTIDQAQAREIIDKAYRDATTRPLLPQPIASKSEKILKQKSFGFIPNFSAFKDAVQRELDSGIPMSKIRLGQDNRLINKTNPMGFGIYNTEDEPNGLKQGIASKSNLNEARKAGAYSGGFIPNFAAPFMALSPGAMSNLANNFNPMDVQAYARDEIKKAKAEFQKIVGELRNQQISLKNANQQVDQLKLKYNLSNQSVSNMNTSLQGVVNSTRSFNRNVSRLERSAGGFMGLGGGRSLRELERLEQNATGARAQRASDALSRARQSREAGLGRLQGVGLAASFGVPIVAQTIAGFAPENKYAQGAAEGIGTAASFAGIGAIFGPVGIAVGGVVGALVGFKKALDIVNDKTKEFAKQAERSQAQLSRFNENVQAFLSTRTQIEGLKSGEVKGTKADITRLEKEQRNALARIFNEAGPEITQEIKDAIASGNEEGLKEAFGKAGSIKQSRKEIDGFISSIEKIKKEKKLGETFNENIIELGNLKTVTGETFGELIANNERLMESLAGYANAVDLTSFTTEKGLERLQNASKDINDIFGQNYSPIQNLENGPKSVMFTGAPGGIPFSEEDINKKISELVETAKAMRNLESTIGGPMPIYFPNQKNIDTSFDFKSPEAQRLAAAQALAEDLAAKNLKNFGLELQNFVQGLVDAKKITEKNGKDLQESLSTILEGPGTNPEKLKILIEEFRKFGEAGQAAAEVIDNITKGLFNFSQLSTQLSALFSKGDGTESGDVIALEKRRIAAETLQGKNFVDLFKDPEFFKDFQPNNIIKKLIAETSTKISGGTVEESRREEAFTQFTDQFKSELKTLAEGGKLTSIQFARLTAGAERAAAAASLQEENLTTLNRSISDTVLAEEAVQEYLKIETQLRAKFGNNIDKLSEAAKGAAQELILIQKARAGQAFAEETAAGLNQTAITKIRNGIFGGVNVREMTNLGRQDYEKIILDSTTQAVQAVNNNAAFDDTTRNKLINEIILAQEKAMAQLEGGKGKLSIREISDLQTGFQKISERSSILKNGLDQLNLSIGNNMLKEEAKSVLQEKLRELEIKYGDNLVALKEASSALIDVLQKEAQFREGRIFAEDLKAAQEAERTRKIKDKEWTPGDVFGAFSTEMLYGAQDAMRDLNALGTDTARTLKSEFNNAFQSIVDGTSTAGDAFRNMALNMARRIQQLTMEMSTNLLFNSLFSSVGGIPSLFQSPFGKSKGGIIKGYSTGGKVLGGSGVKDDVPAMLSKGEYVIRKSSVKKYGEDFLRELNSGGVIEGLTSSEKNNLKYSEKENLRKNNLDSLKEKLSITSQENLKFNEASALKTKSPLYKVRQGTSSNIRSKNSGKFLKMASGGDVGGKYANYMPSQEEIDKMYESANWQGYGEDEKQGRKVDDKVASQLREGLVNAVTNTTTFDESSMIQGFYSDFGGGASFNLANYYSYDDPRYPTFGKKVVDPLLSYEALTNENNPMNQLRDQRRADLINYLVQGVELGEQNREAVINTIRSNLEERDRVDEINRQQQAAFKQQQQNALFGALMSFGIGLAGAGLSSVLPQFGARSPAEQFMKSPPAGRLSVGQSASNLPKPAIGGRLSVPSVIGTASYPNLPAPSARLSLPTNTSNYLAPTMPSARLSVPQYINPTPATSPTASYQRYVGYQGGYNSPFYQRNTIVPYRGAIYRRQGGPIGFAKGGSPKDNIPALLMGGEYVINKDTVDYYGKNFFDNINKGKIKKFAEGGLVGNTSPFNPAQDQIGKENKKIGDIENEINITININGSSTTSSETSKGGSAGQDKNTLETQKLESERAKALSGKIKTEVIKIITEQQRPGGLLSSEYYKKQA